MAADGARENIIGIDGSEAVEREDWEIVVSLACRFTTGQEGLLISSKVDKSYECARDRRVGFRFIDLISWGSS